MRVAQAQVLVHFQVKLDEQLSIVLQCGHVVNGQAHALRDRANSFKEMLALRSARFGVHHHVRRDNLADALLDGVAQGMHLFEAGGSRHADRGVDEMTVAGAAHAHAVDVQDAVHARHGHGNFLLQALGATSRSASRCACRAASRPKESRRQRRGLPGRRRKQARASSKSRRPTRARCLR